MNIKNFIKLIIVLPFFFINNIAIADPMCEELYKNIYKNASFKDFQIQYFDKQKTIGFRLLKNLNPDKTGWKLATDSNGYFKVGKITSQILEKFSKPDKLKVNDTIISINNLDLRELAKDKKKLSIMETDISDLFEEHEKIVIKFKRNGKIYEINHIGDGSKKHDFVNSVYSFDAPFIDFYVNSIEINEKTGTFKATINTAFKAEQDERYSLSKIVWDTLVKDKEYDQNNNLINYYWFQCSYSDERWGKLDTIDPNYGIEIKNLVREDKNTKTSNYNIRPINQLKNNSSYLINNSVITYESKGVYEISNQYDLKKFPFDKQTLEVFLYNKKFSIDNYRVIISDFSLKKILAFKDENKIQGWNIKNVDLQYKFYKDPTEKDLNFDGVEDFNDGISLIINIERKYWYYIFKIILPIILILTICWSSIWVDPKEIESRLTITIVCLLSLIAYNFVIDEDMPKLDYLTTLDVIILLSYLYAAVPNFLAVLSHHMVKTKDKDILEYEEIQKKFGLPSYIFIVVSIIIYNLIT